MVRLTETMRAARDDGGKAAQTFADVGIAIADVEGKARPVDDVMMDVADRMRALSTEEEKLALSTQLFGAKGAELVKLLGQGSDAIGVMREEASKLGFAMTDEEAQRAEQYNDQMLRFKRTMEGVRNRVALVVLPHLTRWLKILTERFAGVSLRIQEFARDPEKVGRLLDRIATGAKAAGIMLGGMFASKVLSAFATGIKAFRALGTAGMVANLKILAIPAALAAVALLIHDFYLFLSDPTRDTLFGRMVEGLGGDQAEVRGAINTIGEGIGKGLDAAWEGAEKGALAFLAVFGIQDWDEAKEVLEDLGEWVVDTGKKILEWLGIDTPEKFADKMELLGGAFGAAAEAVGKFGGAVIEVLKERLGPVVEWLLEKFSDVLDAWDNISKINEKIEKEQRDQAEMYERGFAARVATIAPEMAEQVRLEPGDLGGTNFPSEALSAAQREWQQRGGIGSLSEFVGRERFSRLQAAQKVEPALMAAGADIQSRYAGGVYDPSREEDERSTARRARESRQLARETEMVRREQERPWWAEGLISTWEPSTEGLPFAETILPDMMASIKDAPEEMRLRGDERAERWASMMRVPAPPPAAGSTSSQRTVSVSVASPQITYTGVTPDEILRGLPDAVNAALGSAIEGAIADDAEVTP
jgi:hypothetical protein